MRFLSTILLLTGCCPLAWGQDLAAGSIINKATNSGVPYVSVFLKSNPALGTVSNIEGKFRLRIPSTVPGDSVVFSHVGFKRTAVSLETIPGTMVVRLEEAERMLSEVVIMAEDGLLSLMKRAYEKIEVNYATSGVLFRGFYRETNQLNEENRFLYFAESTIEFYKPGYKNKQFGPVKILKGGKSEIGSRSKYSNIYFYAGIYSPQRFDFAKERIEFINPENFNRYKYHLESVIKNGDRETMEISFVPTTAGNAKYTGKLFIDKATLAYTGASYDLTKSGLRERNNNLLSSVQYNSSHLEVNYRNVDGLWFINLVIADGVLYNPKYKNHIRYTSEYATTSFQAVDGNPISDAEAIAYSSIYTQQDAKFTDDYWNDTETIERNSALEKDAQLLFRKSDLNIEDESETDNTKKKERAQAFVKFILRMQSGLGVTRVPIASQGGLWSVGYQNVFHLSKDIDMAAQLWAIDYDLKVSLNRSFSAFLNVSNGLSQSKNYGLVDVGILYRKIIAGWRRPLFLESAVGIGYSSISQKLGSFVNSTDFKVEKTVFDAGRSIDLMIGSSGFNLMPAIQLNYNFTSKLHLYSGVSMYVPLGQTDRLMLRQKNSLFDIRSASLDLKQTDLSINGNPYTDSPFHIIDYGLLIRAGIAIGLN